jgi:hypothetical protein
MQGNSPRELASALRSMADLIDRILGPAVPDSVPECPAVLAPLSPTQEDALEAAADGEWRSSIDLAGEAGWPYGGHWRGLIADLVRRGLMERDRRTKRLRRPQSVA